MVTYIRSDLDFILQQIKLSEQHASGTPLYGTGGLIPDYNMSLGVRTVDGTYNNLLDGQQKWGAADTPFPSYLPPKYPDGYTPGATVVDGDPRLISNLLVDQTLSNPAAIIEALRRNEIGGDHIALATEIKGAYERPLGSGSDAKSVKQLFVELEVATDAYDAALAAWELNPSQGTAARDAALADLNEAKTLLTSAVNHDPDGAGAAEQSLQKLLDDAGIELDAANIVLPNIAPDVGLSAPFNSWFTLFGQFFDHGLDMVGKGGAGTVFVPLAKDDPLYNKGADGIAGTLDDVGADGMVGTQDDPVANFMMLTRATLSNGKATNSTTSFVDQNQTYSSHPSHQVFLRQYELRGDKPVDTGKLLEGSKGDDGGMATWGELKAQARIMLGIELTDADVGRVPLLRTDPYGNFVRGANGLPQVSTSVGADGIPGTSDDTWVEGNLADPINLSAIGAIRTNQAFLADIAHEASPFGSRGATLTADTDGAIGLSQRDGKHYDDELLDAHFMAGDGRVNENIGLTAVHHVFHAEHNRLVEHTKGVVIDDARQLLAAGASQAQAVAFLNEWLDVDVSSVPQSQFAVDALVWDGDRLFQAAKFGTEMQYQHLVFEEFARKIQPNINAFVVPSGYDAEVNPAIMAEFAHTVYRFGHSMLTETVDRFDGEFGSDHIGLIQAFLNPVEFNADGATDDGIAAGEIIRGMTRQTGNQIDEFVTDALRNNLLGLPLDLATINLARGRDTGVPTLNAARREFYKVTDQNSALKPYESWTDFAAHLKNEASIINFVASYGTHTLITSQDTAEERRDAALAIITGTTVNGIAPPSDRVAFLNATGTWAGGSLGGLENVDFWIGGLAEETMPFGGMLGSTFGFVFEVQLEALQNGDRFYYLQRLTGLHLFGELEGNSFASLIERNTDATHLPSDVFSTPRWFLEADISKQANNVDDDPTLEIGEDPSGGSLLTPLVIRTNPNTTESFSKYLQYTGEDHVMLGGTEGRDKLIAGDGDDTLHGDGGDDSLEGGFGNDILNGGTGNDIIRDMGGDDNIKGGDGHDAIHAGPGLDLVLGGRGQDFVILGTDVASEAFGGEGNDFIMGSRNSEPIIGNEGDDWLEDGMVESGVGDNNDDLAQGDGIRGNDVMLGGDGSTDEMIMEGGDDIMVGSLGGAKVAGMSGFDWSTYKDMPFGMTISLSEGFLPDELPQDPTLQRFESVEGLSGTQFNDVLVGTDFTSDDRLPGLPDAGAKGSALDATGIALIGGLQTLLGAGVTSYSAGDILLGGKGSDRITGGGGNDYIDGDKWLDVRIEVRAAGETIATAHSMKELAAELYNGTYNAGQLVIVRNIEEATGGSDIDIAVFSGARADYDVTFRPDGTVRIVHARGTQADGADILRNIETARFADRDMSLLQGNTLATGAPVINDLTPREGLPLTVNTASIADANGLGTFRYQWQMSIDNGLTWSNIAGATAATFTPTDLAGMNLGPQAGNLLKVVVSFIDGAGHNEQLESLATAQVGVNWAGNANANTLQGTAGDDTASGNGGNDTLNGNDGVDTLNGNGGNDILNGGGDADILSGGADNDTMTGGGGNDTIDGNGGNDVAVYTFNTQRYTLTANATGLVVTAVDANSEGVDTIINTETLRFNGTNYAVVQGTDTGQTHTTNGGSQIIAARGGADTINAGAGSDIILAGAGNDRINQNSGQAGRDFVDGGAGTDTFALNGTGAAEAFQILTRAQAIAAGFTDLHSTTEIVVTRRLASDPVEAAVIITELDNVEEILVNTLSPTNNNGNGRVDGGTSQGDTISVLGDFRQTSLDYSTITVNGGRGTDKVDITGLTSDHRIVLNTNGGSDGIIGAVRPQDLINDASSSGFALDRNAIADLRNSSPAQLQMLIDGLPQHAGWSVAAKVAALMMHRDLDGSNHVHKFAHDCVMERHELRFDDADNLLTA